MAGITAFGAFGTGYLGVNNAACTAEFGHDALGVDIDEGKPEGLTAREPGFYNPRFNRRARREFLVDRGRSPSLPSSRGVGPYIHEVFSH